MGRVAVIVPVQRDAVRRRDGKADAAAKDQPDQKKGDGAIHAQLLSEEAGTAARPRPLDCRQSSRGQAGCPRAMVRLSRAQKQPAKAPSITQAAMPTP